MYKKTKILCLIIFTGLSIICFTIGGVLLATENRSKNKVDKHTGIYTTTENSITTSISGVSGDNDDKDDISFVYIGLLCTTGAISLGIAFVCFLCVIFFRSSTNTKAAPTRNKPAVNINLPSWFSNYSYKDNTVNIRDFIPFDWDSIKVPHDQAEPIIEEVTKLIYNTWKYNKRLGKDSVNLKHNSLEIRAVCILHNEMLIDKYKTALDGLICKALTYDNEELPKLSCVRGQKDISTKDSLLGSAINMYDNHALLPETNSHINETFLFHGTKTCNLSCIMQYGFKMTWAKSGLYGKALYMSESSEKADQYTDNTYNRRDKNLCMLLVRTGLGMTYVHKPNTVLQGLPCKRKNCLTPDCTSHETRFDSAVAGLNKRFREFLMYDMDICYPQVFVFYDRTETRSEGDIPCYIIGSVHDLRVFKVDDKNKKIEVNNVPACSIINESNTNYTSNESHTKKNYSSITYYSKTQRIDIMKSLTSFLQSVPCKHCLHNVIVQCDKSLVSIFEEMDLLHMKLNFNDETKRKQLCSDDNIVVHETYNLIKEQQQYMALFDSKLKQFNETKTQWIKFHEFCGKITKQREVNSNCVIFHTGGMDECIV